MSAKIFANNIFEEDFAGLKEPRNAMEEVFGYCVYNYPISLEFSEIPKLIKNNILNIDETEETILKWIEKLKNSNFKGFQINFF